MFNLTTEICGLVLAFIAGAWIGRPMFAWLGAKTPWTTKA
tara:strand:- start:343 stop:462 length:120 start_codon:yes stop_codon:yes gene_type:complete